MADLDRGQLMLVTALVLAVGLVALVLLLNSAIYTQNVAMRGGEVADHNALQYRAETAGAVAELVTDGNREEYDTWGEVRENVTAGIERYDELARHVALKRSAYASVNETTISLREGRLLRQTDDGRALLGAGGESNWTVTAGVSDLRAFDVTVADQASLADTASPASAGFNVTLRGAGGDRWRVHVYDDGGTSLAVKNGSDTIATDVCPGAVTGEPTVDLTAGTVNGQPCPALQFGKGTTAPYTLAVTNGADLVGTFNVTVNATAVTTGNFNGPGPAASPYKLPAVYDATYEVVYESAHLRYVAEDRVAPGETP